MYPVSPLSDAGEEEEEWLKSSQAHVLPPP